MAAAISPPPDDQAAIAAVAAPDADLAAAEVHFENDGISARLRRLGLHALQVMTTSFGRWKTNARQDGTVSGAFQASALGFNPLAHFLAVRQRSGYAVLIADFVKQVIGACCKQMCNFQVV